MCRTYWNCFSALNCFIILLGFIFAGGKFDVIFINGMRDKYINHLLKLVFNVYQVRLSIKLILLNS